MTADEGDIGRGHLGRFQDVETTVPTILTTSQLLTTGVDAPTCKNIVLARVIGSMTEFRQIVGRGTRLRDDYGKLWFNILDYTGSATRMFGLAQTEVVELTRIPAQRLEAVWPRLKSPLFDPKISSIPPKWSSW